MPAPTPCSASPSASALLSEVEKLLKQGAAATKNGKQAAGKALDRNTIRAAVTMALESAMPSLIEELTERVLLVLAQRN